MNTIKVNILSNPGMNKPGNKEYSKIQKIICKDENIQELDFIRLIFKLIIFNNITTTHLTSILKAFKSVI